AYACRNAPVTDRAASHELFHVVQSQRRAQLPCTPVKERDLERDCGEAQAVKRENSATFCNGMNADRLPETAIAQAVKHSAENDLQGINIDQHGENHRPANETGDAVFQSEPPAPEPMTAPEKPHDRDGSSERRHVVEGAQYGIQIIRHLLSGNHEQADRERDGRIDERLEARHLQTAQTKPAAPRQGIEILRHRRRDLLVALSHLCLTRIRLQPAIYFSPQREKRSSYLRLCRCWVAAWPNGQRRA